jgi:deoxyribodipyrimidine photolyase-related protein
MTTKYKGLRLVLGDQLNASHSWFSNKNDDIVYVLAELHQETNYVTHHIQKVSAFFAAMTEFANALKAAGHRVLHLTLDDTKQFTDLPELLSALFTRHDIEFFEYQLPDEYRLRQQLDDFCNTILLPTTPYQTEHFFLADDELPAQFSQGKRHRMEAFYRKMRKRFDILMDQGEPEGGQWNYDSKNRNKLKSKDFDTVPKALVFANDVTDILARLERHQIATIGKAESQLLWPINRQQALTLLNYFCQHCLCHFGQFQDAMTGKLGEQGNNRQWSLFHARISFALNSKMLSPKTVIDTVIHFYRHSEQVIDLAQVEGFVRQILGWREFIRGIYWANMPEYSHCNGLSATQTLPAWFWSANTKMNCLKQAISQSLEFAYAHHIQRLMITGNFCLLTGIAPEQVDQWYLGIYIDAIEWVELPNTRGMSQFADDGIVGSKAYAASGNYVKNMSDYCSDCEYKVTQTTEQNACPLNALYWGFMNKHQAKFASNPRNSMVYANWKKKSAEQQQAILDRANWCIEHIECL